ncbi:MAG: hypothetical protein ABR97_12090 [Rhodobacter sp. BACL10 MAG-120419-bin15]|nr:MAG: hypothetical protein ABR97_12090 [Rhodobacter sp. BACL10 MAG-120419-bin15]
MEVKTLIDEGYETARRVLTDNPVEFERLAQGLLEYETLTGDEIKKVVAGEVLGGDEDEVPASPLASVVAMPKTKSRAAKSEKAPNKGDESDKPSKPKL